MRGNDSMIATDNYIFSILNLIFLAMLNFSYQGTEQQILSSGH